MSIFQKFQQHADLFGRMTRTLGVDMSDAAGTGRAADATLRSAVISCMGCRKADACGEWLDAHSDGAGETPDYCRNKAMLDRLARV
jgi:hypothetical protein